MRDREPTPSPGGMPPGRERRPLVLSRPIWSLPAWPRLLAVGVGLILTYWGADRLLIAEATPAADITLLDAVVGGRTGTTVQLARILTFLGDLWVVLLVWAVLVTLARRRSGRWDLAWLVTVVVIGALLITGIVKDITDRARPDGALVEAASFAFPSGHAGRAAAVWGLVAWLALRWGRNRWTRVGVGALAVAMAVATGLARVVLGIHWPSDVLFGWMLGLIWLTACILIVQPRHGVPRPDTVLDEITDVLSHTLLSDRDDDQRRGTDGGPEPAADDSAAHPRDDP